MFSRSSLALAMKVITKIDLQQKLAARGPKMVLIDVREPSETQHGIIPTAKLIPLAEVEAALTRTPPEAFKKRYGFDKPEEGDEIVFYCRSGVRSDMACSLAERYGYLNVVNYKGSYLDWVA